MNTSRLTSVQQKMMARLNTTSVTALIPTQAQAKEMEIEELTAKVRTKLQKVVLNTRPKEVQGRVYNYTFWSVTQSIEEMKKLLNETNEVQLIEQFESAKSSTQIHNMQAYTLTVCRNKTTHVPCYTSIIPAVNGDHLNARIRSGDEPLTDNEIQKKRLYVGSEHMTSCSALFDKEKDVWSSQTCPIELNTNLFEDRKTIYYREYPFLTKIGCKEHNLNQFLPKYLVGVYVEVKPLPADMIFNLCTRPCLSHPYLVMYGKSKIFKEELRKELVCLASEEEGYKDNDETYVPNRVDRGNKFTTWEHYIKKNKFAHSGPWKTTLGNKHLLTLKKTTENKEEQHIFIIPLTIEQDQIRFIPFYNDVETLVRYKGYDIFDLNEDKTLRASLKLQEVELRDIPILNASFTFEPSRLSINHNSDFSMEKISDLSLLKSLINRYKHAPSYLNNPEENCRIHRLTCFCCQTVEQQLLRTPGQCRKLSGAIDAGYRCQNFNNTSRSELTIQTSSYIFSHPKARSYLTTTLGVEYIVDNTNANTKITYVPVRYQDRKRFLEEDNEQPYPKKPKMQLLYPPL